MKTPFNIMDKKNHWENVYETKSPTDVSWFQPHLQKSLELIDAAGLNADAHIIDVGGGASTLMDDLLERGFKKLTVLDISAKALEDTKKRLCDKGRVVS
jgi:ubiquinone/menaquinone biosynthesis C-methylase UbiE